MNDQDFPGAFARALGLTWKAPPADAVRRASRRPRGEPLAPPPPGSREAALRSPDVRGAGAQVDAAEGLVSRALDGLDVTVMVTPPEGDGLWTIRGRVWPTSPAGGSVRVALVQGENVLDEVTVDATGQFRFQDALAEDWAIEFHLEDGRVAVLRSPSSRP